MGATGEFDVVVVGAGVLGCAVAARLSATTARVCVIEAERDVAEHASKGNAGIAVSYYGPPGIQQTELINASWPHWEDLTGRLQVPYRRIGAVMVATDDVQAERLEHTRDEIHACGVRAEMLDGADARRLEPLITPHCVAAISMPDEGVIDPMRLTVAYARLAAHNGVAFRFGERVTRIDHDDDGRTSIATHVGTRLRARFVVNAAGVATGVISELAGGETLHCWPRKGQYVVLDRSFGERLSKIVFSTHLPDTKGSNVVPTTHGSVLLGPTATDHDDADDRTTDTATITEIRRLAALLVPATADAPAIRAFAANRPAGDEAHRLRVDTIVPNLVHVTDRSAGVSLSPAAAERVWELLRGAGLDAREWADAAATLPRVAMLRTAADPRPLIAADPRYGQVVCVCEQVSAAEIDAALSSPIPAVSVDGVRKRCGAMYGRCQGALCMAGISFMTALHTGTGPSDVLHTSRGSLGSGR